jgi:hypothetical protein
LHDDSTRISNDKASSRQSSSSEHDHRSFLSQLIGDGRPLLSLTGLALLLSGAFALFLSATGAFLPHDIDFLGMTPQQLCAVNECRIVHFMFHDRAAFGGTLLAIGTLYLWLTHFPLARKEEWSWWVFLISGVLGFASFLCYLGYGYLDTWHGYATLGLLPCFIVGLWRSWQQLPSPRMGMRCLRRPAAPLEWRTRTGMGRLLVTLTGLGKIGGGAVIMTVGMSSVFVPQDLEYIGLQPEAMAAINPRLIPLIAHDRAGFGGALVSCGALVALIAWKSPITRPLWQALLFAGSTGFACAIGVHFCIGYTDAIHLAPAVLGAVIFASGMFLSRPR